MKPVAPVIRIFFEDIFKVVAQAEKVRIKFGLETSQRLNATKSIRFKAQQC